MNTSIIQENDGWVKIDDNTVFPNNSEIGVVFNHYKKKEPFVFSGRYHDRLTESEFLKRYFTHYKIMEVQDPIS